MSLIEELASDGRKYRIIHVCGTPEDTITKHGVRSMLPRNVEVIMGSGCQAAPNSIVYGV